MGSRSGISCKSLIIMIIQGQSALQQSIFFMNGHEYYMYYMYYYCFISSATVIYWLYRCIFKMMTNKQDWNKPKYKQDCSKTVQYEADATWNAPEEQCFFLPVYKISSLKITLPKTLQLKTLDFLQQTITMNENVQWQMIKDSVLFALSWGFSISLFHFYLKKKID